MRLYFTRHGESEANRLRVISNRDLPHPLTEAGRLQALALADRLRLKPITRIYASPLLRARQTGEILSASLSVPLELVDGLREPDCGVLEGRGDAEAWAAHKTWLDTWLSGRELDKGPTGGETYHAVRERFTSFIKALVIGCERASDEFVLVTHGEAMLIGLPGLVGNLDAKYILEHGLGYADILCVECREGKLMYRG